MQAAIALVIHSTVHADGRGGGWPEGAETDADAAAGGGGGVKGAAAPAAKATWWAASG